MVLQKKVGNYQTPSKTIRQFEKSYIVVSSRIEGNRLLQKAF